MAFEGMHLDHLPLHSADAHNHKLHKGLEAWTVRRSANTVPHTDNLPASTFT